MPFINKDNLDKTKNEDCFKTFEECFKTFVQKNGQKLCLSPLTVSK